MNILHLAAVALLSLCSTAFAHGGTYRGPPRGPPPPPPCVCGDLTCSSCSHDELVSGTRLDTSETEVDALGEWGAVRSLLITATFRSKEERNIEAYAALHVAPVFGVTGASIEQGTATLSASLTAAEKAREQYFTTKFYRRDPLLLTQTGPGNYDLRACPVSPGTPTIVFIEGFALGDAPCRALQLYRDGGAADEARYMAVVPLSRHRPTKDAAIVDRERNRAVYFLDAKGARERFGSLTERAVRLPGAVTALERAVRGDPSRVWVAVEALPASRRAADPPPPPAGPPAPTSPPVESPPPPDSVEPVEPVGQLTTGDAGS